MSLDDTNIWTNSLQIACYKTSQIARLSVFKAIFFRNLKQILAKQTANLGHEFSGAMQDLLHFSLDSRNFE